MFHCARVGLGALGVVTRSRSRASRRSRCATSSAPAGSTRWWRSSTQSSRGTTTSSCTGSRTPTRARCCATTAPTTAPRPKSAYKRWRAEVFYPNYFFGALVTAGQGASAAASRGIAQLVAGTVGSARLVDRSDRILISTRLLRFVEMEYAIPREHAVDAMQAGAPPHRGRRTCASTSRSRCGSPRRTTSR